MSEDKQGGANSFLDSQRDAINERVLNYRVEEFIRNWSPEDRRDRAQFAADLVTIVQAIHADAVNQWAKHIEAAAMRAVTLPTFVAVDKRPG